MIDPTPTRARARVGWITVLVGSHLARDVAGGELGAIIVASEAWAADSDVWCGGGQVVVVVPLP